MKNGIEFPKNGLTPFSGQARLVSQTKIEDHFIDQIYPQLVKEMASKIVAWLSLNFKFNT